MSPLKVPHFRRFMAFGLILGSGLVLGGWMLLLGWGDRSPAPPPEPVGPISLDFASPHQASYVGGQACRECHAEQYDLWKGSHHDLAMKPATPETVLGDFGDASFEHQGVTSTFRREGEKYIVRTQGEDGELHDYQVLYTFGWTPLQQYLVAFPGGRLQTLPLCWDTRPASSGGQRWFHIYGDEHIPPGDPLFWTGPNQNWNFMCAECHSTNLKKRYDAEAASYHTTWAEVNVSCEACHGPGSAHLEWAKGKSLKKQYPLEDDKGLVVRLRDLTEGRWHFNPETRFYERKPPLASRVQAETCARCHARRATLVDDYAHGRSIHDAHRVEPLSEGMYHADGQILEEVYVYGSFLQSRMYAAGVRCVDCHEPHSLKFRREGNALCTYCHTSNYNSVEHHFHPKPGEGTKCVDCHMAQRTYMQVDPRRDHSFRIPRPDLTVALGTPNACNDCHTKPEETPQWAADLVAKWYGPRDKTEARHYAHALHAARRGMPSAPDLLAELLNDADQPAIVRATALREAAATPTRELLTATVESLASPDPMVRAAAVSGLRVLPPEQRWHAAAGLLEDPIRSVRIATVGVLAAGRAGVRDAALARRYDAAEEEYIAVHSEQLDRASGYFSLGLLHADRGRLDAAEQAYRKAVALEPWFVPAVMNLAMLQRQRGDEAGAQKTLQQAAKQTPSAPLLRYELGMSLVRQRQVPAALSELRAAAQLGQDVPRFAYGYAVALHSTGEPEQAIGVLADSLKRHPHDAATLFALAAFSRDAGRLDDARRYARQLVAAWPNDAQGRALLRSLGPAE